MRITIDIKVFKSGEDGLWKDDDKLLFDYDEDDNEIYLSIDDKTILIADYDEFKKAVIAL